MSTSGRVVWITGLPGSGKNTLAEAIGSELAKRNVPFEIIDSGKLRETLLGDTLGFSRKDRDANCRRNAFVASLLAKNGVVAIVSSVSPYRSTRDALRQEMGGFVEVWVSTPKEVCVDWDPKGLWAKALAGEIRQFTGVDDPYEPPLSPEVEADLSQVGAGEAAMRVVEFLEKRGTIAVQTKEAEPLPAGFESAD
jgi:adenylylsulfate kinase